MADLGAEGQPSGQAADVVGYAPVAAADNASHIDWPQDSDGAAHFAAAVIGMLQSKDYCVVQMALDEESGSAAFEEAQSGLLDYKPMRTDFYSAYLGSRHRCKTAWMDALAEDKEEAVTVLDNLDLHFAQFTQLMVPVAPYALGFSPYSRTAAMVRVPFQSPGEESKMKSQERTIDDDDIADGLVDAHIEFLKRRKLCMLLIAESAGGSLTLVPKDIDSEPVQIGTQKGRFVIFRHDKMSYDYKPSDNTDLVMQSWVLAPPDELHFPTLETPNAAAKDEIMGLHVGPSTPEGLRTDAIGIGISLPCGADFGSDSYWAAVSSGTDGQIKAPMSRFDMDFYYAPADSWNMGQTYTMHGGFVLSDIYALDNVFFNITENDAVLMAPAQKAMLEKGYEALYNSGYRRKSLKGKKIGVFCGHSGDDWTFTTCCTYGCGDTDPTNGYASRIWATIPGRLAYTFGLKGPQTVVDTACSSALVAYGVGHTMLRKAIGDQGNAGVDVGLNEGLMLGSNMIPGPGNYINLCGPHMLSATGRCLTFDASADGFERGEGSGAFLCRNQQMRTEDATCTMIGACLNQDGRSASMTAPNGPAQQDCIRGSMKEAGLTANQVTCAELHGTGTALGDPIEVGSLRGVMQDRNIPLMQSSAKTHLGHLEASAGTAGVIKCMMMCAACAASPNCHLVSLNPHLDINGYPTVIATEISDYGYNSGYSGVSSFGFGGANSRADVFAKCSRGPHRVGKAMDMERLDYITVTCPFDEGPIHYLDGKAVPANPNKRHRRDGPYHADAIRDEFASYDYSSNIYSGRYQITPAQDDFADEPPDDPVYIVGTWDACKKPKEMEMTEGEGIDRTYSFTIMLGETRVESFQLRVDKDPYRAIYPVVKSGSMRTRVTGPDESGDGLNWTIDGRDDEVPVGTPYKITLSWGEQLKMRWEKVDRPSVATEVFRHSYSVVSSFTSWMMTDMNDVSSKSSPNTWEFTARIGMSGAEYFRFCRDHDTSQIIYPVTVRTDPSLGACGPDNLCKDTSWSVKGTPGELVSLSLQVVDAHITIKYSTPSSGSRTVESLDGPQRHSFHVCGTFTDWQYAEMTPDPEVPGIFRYRGESGPTGEDTFRVCVDAEPAWTLYPELPGSYPGDSIVQGPSEVDADKCFSIFALKAGATFEIVVDRQAVDKRKTVDIKWVTDRFDYDSMKSATLRYLGVPTNSLL